MAAIPEEIYYSVGNYSISWLCYETYPYHHDVLFDGKSICMGGC